MIVSARLSISSSGADAPRRMAVRATRGKTARNSTEATSSTATMRRMAGPSSLTSSQPTARNGCGLSNGIKSTLRLGEPMGAGNPAVYWQTMNLLHRRYCRSDAWRRAVHHGMMPWVLRNVELGANVLEIGPGPGVTTDWLRERFPALTSVEIDHDLDSSLKKRDEEARS